MAVSHNMKVKEGERKKRKRERGNVYLCMHASTCIAFLSICLWDKHVVSLWDLVINCFFSHSVFFFNCVLDSCHFSIVFCWGFFSAGSHRH